jgi:hypothetical protein
MTFAESLRATTLMSLPAIIAVVLVAIIGLILGSSPGCSPAETKHGVKSALDLADTICEATTDQDDPEWQKILCKYIDKADQGAKIFLVRVPKKTFAASRPCNSTGATSATAVPSSSATAAPPSSAKAIPSSSTK